MQFRQSWDWTNASCGFVSHWNQWIIIMTPEAYVTWWRVFARAWCLVLAGVALCLFLSWSWQIILPVFHWIFADSSSQPFLTFRSFIPFWEVWGSVEYFSTNLLSIWQCQLAAAYRDGSCSWGSHGWVKQLIKLFIGSYNSHSVLSLVENM